MRNSLLGATALISVAMLANAAQAATYVPTALPTGAVSMVVFGINDSNIITGSYTDSAGVQHGYFGPPDGSNYTTFDLTGVTGTQPRAILNDGTITGLALASGFTFGEEFFRATDGTIKIIKKKTLVFDGVAQGGNDSGIFMGDYINKSGIRVGYHGQNGKYLSAFKLPISVASTDPRQVNNNNVVTGSYLDSAGTTHGFYLKGTHFKSFDYPGSVSVTAAEGINDAGQITGLWTDSAGNRHGFLLDTATKTFTQIGPNDGSTFQEAWGINSKGLISGDSNGTTGWIYCPLARKKCPKGAAAAVHPGHVPPLKNPINLP